MNSLFGNQDSIIFSPAFRLIYRLFILGYEGKVESGGWKIRRFRRGIGTGGELPDSLPSGNPLPPGFRPAIRCLLPVLSLPGEISPPRGQTRLDGRPGRDRTA
jgi:hypothetical protein